MLKSARVSRTAENPGCFEADEDITIPEDATAALNRDDTEAENT
jgi:hypothetical protein